MARPLRIEYANAWYHILNRGRRGELIFTDTYDYIGFIDLLVDTSEQWNLRVAAYCLVPNHYHILVQTPDANFSRCMRHIDGVYTQRFNRRHECDGSLFRGRYKSILNVKERFLPEKANDEEPQSRELAPTTAQIKTAVCKQYRLNNDELLVSKRGGFNELRNVAIYLTRRLRTDSLKQIGEQFGNRKYSSVSSVIERMKTVMAKDHKLRRRVESIVWTLSKSQEQT